MRTFIFLLCSTVFGFTSNEIFSQNAKIHIDKSQTLSVDEVFDLLGSQTDYSFIYPEGFFKDVPKVQVNKGTIRAGKLLKMCVLYGGVTLDVNGNIITIIGKTGSDEKMQSLIVSGKVSDSFGQPLPGASIIEQGTTNGVTTDFDGNFSIKIQNENAILLVSYVGFASKEVAAETTKTIEIILEEDTANLDEIVVIGYGTAKKSDLTGAVASADLKNAEETSNVSIIQALQGSIAGLNVGAVTNAGDNPSLTIRGQNSLSNSEGDNQPLIVLDGIIYRGNLIDINPADIKSVDILKDASSTAIYGSQASNGVIVITSKGGGISLSKPKINYSTSYTVQTPSNRFEPMNAAEYEQFYPDIFWAQGGRIAPDYLNTNPDYDFTTNLKTNEIRQGYEDGIDTPWFDLLTGSGAIKSHNLSIQGKSDALGYFISLGVTDQEGFIQGDEYERYNFRVNLDAKINNWLTIGTQTFMTVSDYSGQAANYQNAYFNLQPWAPIRDDNGELIPNPEGQWLNPFLALEIDDSDIRYNLSNVLYANLQLPIDGLSYKLNYANNYRTTDQSRFDPSAANFQGSGSKDHSKNRDWTFDNILNYTKTFNNDHNVNATLVYGVEKRQLSSTLAAASNFSLDLLGYNNLSAGDPTLNEVSSTKEAETSIYQMGRLLYNYQNKYFFTGTIRRDGFSGFGANDKIAVFPSAALGWVITNEDFVNDSSWMNYLKLRVSYGKSGRRGLGRYDTLSETNVSPSVVFGDGGQTFLGQEPISLSNPDLAWEATTGSNFAFDFGLFDSRVNGTVDYYTNKTENILYQISLPEITGFETINSNVAEVSNSGVELTLNLDIINQDKFNWNTSFNFNRVRNKIESILGADNDGDGVEDDLIGNQLFIGEPQNVNYGYEIIGMWQLEDEANGNIWQGFLPGTYKLADLNNDGEINSLDDRKILNYRDPSYNFGIGNTITYKNFSTYFFINSIQGGKDYFYGNDTPHAQNSLSKSDQLSYSNVPSGAWDYWMPENPEAKYRRLDTASQYGGDPLTQRNFVRLQDVTFKYALPADILEKIHINSASLFLSGKNLVTWTKWNGSDPETGVGFAPTSPLLRSYTLGLNVQF
ncbi:SusC/RagA family TonB-linked outer membrane protein [Zobellia galactanivorans]|uniref:TonB-dependent Transducer n=1 Tax=Zobellia galactanivorans (strain DSM 12802 / CCUG 47099 / CIP 106680 / NCIMB 13871 / Dsij) TaxID=63186 RepID=G0L2L6_ZOBGA|nr:TonB-dependent receptor [Zobellia galactanivorans]CAZ95062.1 TonB-dependent Transducer [Zobellia galactanivorans]